MAHLNVAELGPPRLDTLIKDRWYFADCHLEVDRSKVPKLRGIPNAMAWNDSIRAVFDEIGLLRIGKRTEKSRMNPTCGVAIGRSPT